VTKLPVKNDANKRRCVTRTLAISSWQSFARKGKLPRRLASLARTKRHRARLHVWRTDASSFGQRFHYRSCIHGGFRQAGKRPARARRW
jgi:hypothetical protein